MLSLLPLMDSALTHWAHFVWSCSIRKWPQVGCSQTTCLPHLVALESTVCAATRDPTVAHTTSSSWRLRWHIEKGKMMVIAINLLPPCGRCKYELECSLSCGGCKGLHCSNITLPQIWTRVFLVMWWLQRTPLLKYHITRVWQMFSQIIDINTIST